MALHLFIESLHPMPSTLVPSDRPCPTRTGSKGEHHRAAGNTPTFGTLREFYHNNNPKKTAPASCHVSEDPLEEEDHVTGPDEVNADFI